MFELVLLKIRFYTATIYCHPEVHISSAWFLPGALSNLAWKFSNWSMLGSESVSLCLSMVVGIWIGKRNIWWGKAQTMWQNFLMMFRKHCGFSRNLKDYLLLIWFSTLILSERELSSSSSFMMKHFHKQKLDYLTMIIYYICFLNPCNRTKPLQY